MPGKYIYKTDGSPIILPDVKDGFALGVSDIGPKVEVIIARKILHTQLFDVDVDGATAIRNPQFNHVEVANYRKLLLYVDSSYPVSFLVSVYESVGGTYGTPEWTGESFSLPNESAYIPAVSSTTFATLRYPMHRAFNKLSDGMIDLQIRFRAQALSSDTHSDGQNYELKYTLIGVK